MQEHTDGEAIVRLFLTLLNIPTSTLRAPCLSQVAEQHEVCGDKCQMADSGNNPQKNKNSGTFCVRKVDKARGDGVFNVHCTEDSSCPYTQKIRGSEEADRFLLHERQVVVKHSGRVSEFTPASNQNVATKDTSLMDSVVNESDADGGTDTVQIPPQILSKRQNLKHQNTEEKCKQTQRLKTAHASQEEEVQIQTKDCVEHEMIGHLHSADVTEGGSSPGNDNNSNNKGQRCTRSQSQRRPSAKYQQADLAELSQQPKDNLDTSVQMERTESRNLKRVKRHSEKRQENPQSSHEQDSSSASSSVASMTVQASQFTATVSRGTEETDMTLTKVTSSIARQQLSSASKRQTGDVTQCPVCGKMIRSSRALQMHRKACQDDKSLKSKQGTTLSLSLSLCEH